ncbi:MAG: hypothetical protein AAFQ16_11245, partial [Pseudomonadota bacterium]
MAKIWKEPLDPDVHRDLMSGIGDGGCCINTESSDGFVYFVRECSFTFQFASPEQIEIARDYFTRKTHPGVTLEHYWQRWFERLPKGLIGGSNRTRAKLKMPCVGIKGNSRMRLPREVVARDL